MTAHSDATDVDDDDLRGRLLLDQFTRIHGHGHAPSPEELQDFKHRRSAVSRFRGRLLLRRRAALMIMRW